MFSDRIVYLLLLIVFAAVLLAGCRGGQPEPAAQASPEWDQYVQEFMESFFAANPHMAVNAGRHEFDGQLPDWSADGIRREIERLKAQRQRAAGFAEDSLDERQRFERQYLLAAVDGELFWLEQAEWPFRNPIFYSGAVDPAVYVTREYAPLDQRMRAYIRYARNIPRFAGHIRGNLRAPLPRTYVSLGRQVFGGMAAYYEKDIPTIFGAVEDAALQRELRSANGEAIRAMRDLDAWFAAQEKSASDDFAIGADLFRRMLQATEGVDISLEELEKAGRADLERNRAAMREACATLAPGKSEPECVAQVKAKKPESGPVQAARRQLDILRAFLEQKDLVSIPGPEQAKVEEAPPYARWNFAYIDIPGPYEQNLPSIYYIAPPDPQWSPSERREYIPGEADLLFTSVHEVWPGHFLHFLHANRAPSKFGQVFVGYAFAEGWAHYSEELMWEAGLGDGDPEIRIGMLLNALLRNARYLSAIGLHTGKMTVEESERLFREKGLQDAATAKQQAARGTFDPAYLNYTMGKLMIRKMRADWTARRGGRNAWKQFHDRFLSYGGPPIPQVRRAMMGRDDGALF